MLDPLPGKDYSQIADDRKLLVLLTLLYCVLLLPNRFLHRLLILVLAKLSFFTEQVPSILHYDKLHTP